VLHVAHHCRILRRLSSMLSVAAVICLHVVKREHNCFDTIRHVFLGAYCGYELLFDKHSIFEEVGCGREWLPWHQLIMTKLFISNQCRP
jgi:hypothetical protein